MEGVREGVGRKRLRKREGEREREQEHPSVSHSDICSSRMPGKRQKTGKSCSNTFIILRPLSTHTHNPRCTENLCMCTVTHTHTNTHTYAHSSLLFQAKKKGLYGAVSIRVNRGNIAFSHQLSINLGNAQTDAHTQVEKHTVQTRHPW